MTYLQLVNSVLRRIREDEVDSVSQTSYSRLVGEFVNDAKRSVEDSYDWTALRTTLTVTTTSSVFNYTLTGSQNKMKLLDVVNDTSNFFMHYQTAHWFNNAYLNNDAPSGSPLYYSFNGVNDAGDNGVDALRFNVVLRTQDFTVDSSVLKVPSSPVIQIATALASRERGETGGTSAAELFGIADRTLSDAIAFDAAQHPEETIWYS
jgi:hypothetical protein